LFFFLDYRRKVLGLVSGRLEISSVETHHPARYQIHWLLDPVKPILVDIVQRRRDQNDSVTAGETRPAAKMVALTLTKKTTKKIINLRRTMMTRTNHAC